MVRAVKVMSNSEGWNGIQAGWHLCREAFNGQTLQEHTSTWPTLAYIPADIHRRLPRCTSSNVLAQRIVLCV